MSYIDPRIAAVIGPARTEALEKLFARLDSVEAMLKRREAEAEARATGDVAVDVVHDVRAEPDELVGRIQKMHKRRAPTSARELLKR